MKVDKDFPTSTPSETVDRGFDFSNDLAMDETISSATFTVTVASVDDGATVDASPSSRKSGSATISDSLQTELVDVVALQRLTGMTNGNVYLIVCLATTSAGQLLSLAAHQPCRVEV